MRALTLGLLGAGLLLLPIAVVSSQPGAPVVEVLQDREDGMYHVGEQAGFAVRLLAGDQPQAGTVSYTLTNDGVQPPLATGEVTVGDEAGLITGTLEAPGILRCIAWVIAAAAHQGSPARPSTPSGSAHRVAPDDLTSSVRSAAGPIPMDAQLEQREAEGTAGCSGEPRHRKRVCGCWRCPRAKPGAGADDIQRRRSERHRPRARSTAPGAP